MGYNAVVGLTVDLPSGGCIGYLWNGACLIDWSGSG